MAPKDDSGVAWQPNPEVMKLWPDISGNQINGLGDAVKAPPQPVFWRTDGSVPHERAMYYFYDRYKDNEAISASRLYREKTAAIEVSDIAADMVEKSAAEWTALVKAWSCDPALVDDPDYNLGADDVGIAAYRPEWTYQDRDVPAGKWAIVLAFGHDYANFEVAPDDASYIEVMAQYARAGDTAKFLANRIRELGHFAAAKTGPMTEDVLMIPAAIAAGLGELGKHGSIIHPRLGSSFRLSMVLTDMPLEPDAPVVFGGDMFCESCQVCANACPPDAIFRKKQTVRGERKWYVDFDKCVPYFVDNKSCGICLAVCPWSRPGIADNLLVKMARRMETAGG